MKKYSVFLIFPIYFAAVASINIQTSITEGSTCSNNELPGPLKKIGENYYLIEPNITKTWLGAAHFYRTKGAHLASIESEQEWKTLSSYLMSRGYTDQQWFWIGGNDIDQPFKFFWISSGQPMYFTKWSTYQPDNLGGNERCVHLWRKGNSFLMNDWQCQREAHYICKAEISKTVTTTVW